MIEIGRLCVKTAGRDAGLKCAIIDDLGRGLVLIDGQTRRRKCNIRHLEPLSEKLKLGKNASHSDVVKEFKKLKLEIVEKKEKARKKAEKPVKQRKKKEAAAEISEEKAPKTERTAKAEKPAKPEAKKEEKKKEETGKKKAGKK